MPLSPCSNPESWYINSLLYPFPTIHVHDPILCNMLFRPLYTISTFNISISLCVEKHPCLWRLRMINESLLNYKGSMYIHSASSLTTRSIPWVMFKCWLVKRDRSRIQVSLWCAVCYHYRPRPSKVSWMDRQQSTCIEDQKDDAVMMHGQHSDKWYTRSTKSMLFCRVGRVQLPYTEDKVPTTADGSE